MTNTGKKTNGGGIVLLGLGPGDLSLLTREAWEWLSGIDTLYLRTRLLPTVAGLPEHLSVVSFDEVDQRTDAFEALNEEIVEAVLSLANNPEGVTYAVPGHPFVGDPISLEIAKRAKDASLSVRVIDGLSFLEPSFSALGIDLLSKLVLVDAMHLIGNQTPGFPLSEPVLVTQVYSHAIASELKLTLMTAYPESHPVCLVHADKPEGEKLEPFTLDEIDRSLQLGMQSSLYIPPLSPQASFESFHEIIARLRSPEGCPWDREQTHLSLRPFLLEEAYETLDALDRGNMTDLQEELGDLLLQIVLHAQIAAEDGDFNIHQVMDGIGSKLIRRHPHVFLDVDVDGVSGVTRNWEAIKAEERQENGESAKKGLLDGIPLALPALSQAEEIVERVGRVNFKPLEKMGDTGFIQKILRSIERAEGAPPLDLFGELLFAIVSLAHAAGVDAESALRQELSRFRNRFSAVEAGAEASGEYLANLGENEQADLWTDSETNLRIGDQP
jgi:tetrapyrrole methylase family protein / MazG family protein